MSEQLGPLGIAVVGAAMVYGMIHSRVFAYFVIGVAIFLVVYTGAER